MLQYPSAVLAASITRCSTMALRIDSAEQCVGCRQCEATCSVAHTHAFAPWLSRVHIKRNESTLECDPVICRQCKNARCAQACPTGAIQPDENGILRVDETACIGCGACVSACPFHAMMFDDAAQRAFKCDECGGNPQCVVVCPAHVLIWKK